MDTLALNINICVNHAGALNRFPWQFDLKESLLLWCVILIYTYLKEFSELKFYHYFKKFISRTILLSGSLTFCQFMAILHWNNGTHTSTDINKSQSMYEIKTHYTKPVHFKSNFCNAVNEY